MKRVAARAKACHDGWVVMMASFGSHRMTQECFLLASCIVHLISLVHLNT